MLWTTASDQRKPRSAGEHLLPGCKSSPQPPRRVPSRDTAAAWVFAAATALSLHGTCTSSSRIATPSVSPCFQRPPKQERSPIRGSPACLTSPLCLTAWVISPLPFGTFSALAKRGGCRVRSWQGRSSLMPVSTVHTPGVPAAAGPCPRDSRSAGSSAAARGRRPAREEGTQPQLCFHYVSVL